MLPSARYKMFPPTLTGPDSVLRHIWLALTEAASLDQRQKPSGVYNMSLSIHIISSSGGNQQMRMQFSNFIGGWIDSVDFDSVFHYS